MEFSLKLRVQFWNKSFPCGFPWVFFHEIFFLFSFVTYWFSYCTFFYGFPWTSSFKRTGHSKCCNMPVMLKRYIGITRGLLPSATFSFWNPVRKLLFWILRLFVAHWNTTLGHLSFVPESLLLSPWSVLLSFFLLLIPSAASTSFSLLETQGHLCISHSLDTCLFVCLLAFDYCFCKAFGKTGYEA